MERNGDILTEFNYCPERFRLNLNNFDLVDSKMCKDDISKSLFCEVPKSLRNNDILSNELDLKNSCIDLATSEKTFINGDEPILWKSSDPYDFSSSKKMSLNKFISKDSFINGKGVLNASKTSFQIDKCFPSSKSAIASESSLDTTSDSPGEEENSSSSIEEIFCPITNNPAEIKAQYLARVHAQAALDKVKTECISDNPPSEEKPIPKLCSKDSGEVGPRVMPELLPTVICLDDEDEEDSISSYEEKSPPVVSLAGSPEMPKLTAEADELLRLKAGLLSSANKNALQSSAINMQLSLNDSKNIRCQSVDLQTCTRKLFPGAEEVGEVEKLKAKYNTFLSKPVKERDEERGFSFSASFKSSKQQLKNLSCGMDLSKDKTKTWQDKSTSKSHSGNEACDMESPQHTKGNSDKMARKKANLLSTDEADNAINIIRQPKVLLRRISLDQCSSLHGTLNLLPAEKMTFEDCLPSTDSDDNNSLTSQPECDDNSSNEAPEIEEIEGIRFFQFRSKRDMEEFNRKPMVGEIDMEMIVPTKTTDITQIKGWRNKYFATDSQLHYLQSDDGNSQDESSQNAKSVPLLAGSTETKCLDFRNCLNDNKTTLLGLKDTNSDAPKSEVLKPEVKEVLKDEKPTSAMSPFVSKELDDFLLNSATLNIDLLQKFNPNTIPIAPDATILDLGKFSEPDYELNTLAALKRRNFLNKLKEDRKPTVPAIYTDSDDDAVIVLSSSEESSTDDDVPVAKLHNRRKRTAISRSGTASPVSSVKRRKSDESLDGSQRVVLRLTKESKGASDGYKVFNNAYEGKNSEDSVSSSSSSESESELDSEKEELPDEFKKSSDGSEPVIKDSIFLKETEPKLLEEFLNNLNVLGTNKDVAMLVKSNQSYFVKGPVLESEMCSDALDALLTNKEFVDSKNKHTPKKKLKTWQKYLPKKLSKIQQQKITTVHRLSTAGVEKKPPKLEISEKLNAEKEIPSKGNIKQKKYNFMITKTVTSESEKNIVNLVPPVIKEVPKVRKRRSRSAIELSELSDSFSFAERGKRSIRLPARYLDSAVLAAGSEWVYPTFEAEDKKTRKQLLDVLDKITPVKEIVNSEETKKDVPKTEETKKDVPKKEETKKDVPKKEETKKDVPKKVETKDVPKKLEINSSDSPVTKKISSDNNQLNKATKRQIKPSSATKKMKVDDVKDCIRIKESDSPKIASSSIAKNLIEDPLYIFPSCDCSPCSRTLSYKKFTKEFLCFSHYPVPCQISNSNTIPEKEAPPEITLKESPPKDDKLISSVDPKSVKETDNQNQKITSVDPKSVKETNNQNHSPNAITDDSQSERLDSFKEDHSPSKVTNSIKESQIQSEIPEGVQSNTTLPIAPNNLTTPNVPNTVKLLTNKEDGSKKLVYLLSPKSYKPQRPIQLSTESKSKHPILSRKPVSESSLFDGAKSSTNTANPSPAVFKLPVTEKCNNRALLPKLPQTDSLLNNSANIPCNLAGKEFKIGGVYVYSKGNDVNSSPMIAYKITSTKNSNSLPSLVIPDNTNNAAVQEVKPASNDANNASLEQSHSNEANSASLEKSHFNEANIASLPTPPINPIDLHNYNKKITERRRKSPLTERKFKQSPESAKALGSTNSSGDLDGDVDIDTVDEKFNPKTILVKQLLSIGSGSDASDNDDIEYDEIFSNKLPTGKKSITERKRRLMIKKLFETLKKSSNSFNNARNCAHMLDMAKVAVKKLVIKGRALRQAKSVLRFHNTQLLAKLEYEINDIKGAKNKQLMKKRVITVMGNDYDQHCDKLTREKLISSLKGKRIRKRSNTSPIKDSVQADSVSKTDIESQTRVVCKKLDFEIEESPNKMEIINSPIQFEVASKEIEEPHVQLRILEMPSNEIDKDIISLMDTEVEIKEDAPDQKDVNLPQQSLEKSLSIPALAGNLDGNNSDDDDILIIDLEEKPNLLENTVARELEEKTAAKASPPKVEPVLPDIKRFTNPPPPMRKFPGIVPIYPKEFYQADNPFALDLSKFPKLIKKQTLNVDASRIPVNPLSNIISAASQLRPAAAHGNISFQKILPKPELPQQKILPKPELSQQTMAREQISGHSAQSCQPDSRQIPMPGLNLMRNPLHRASKDVKILHGVGNGADDKIQDMQTSKTPTKVYGGIVVPPTSKPPPKVFEEIVIDDSDDEPMDLEQKPNSSSEHSCQFRPLAIDETMMEQDSPIKNSLS